MSQAVARHVPYLPRYARALTGNQGAGDAYVAATLEALIEDPAVLSGGASLRVALYRAFSRIWSSVPVNGEAEPVDARGRVEQRLTHITPRPRQAFLLVAVEGFSAQAAAQILGCDVTTLRGLGEESVREPASESSLCCL